MVQSRTGNPYERAGTAYILIALIVCLLFSSLFKIILILEKYSCFIEHLASLGRMSLIEPEVSIMLVLFQLFSIVEYDVFRWFYFTFDDGYFVAFFDPKLHSDVVTKRFHDCYHPLQLLVVRSIQFEIVHEQEVRNDVL